MKIGFIGLGNMAKAMIGGMLQKDMVKASDILGSAKTQASVERMKKEYGISGRTDNCAVAREADVLVLAVKPQFFPEVIEQIRGEIREDTLIISIAAGKTLR